MIDLIDLDAPDWTDAELEAFADDPPAWTPEELAVAGSGPDGEQAG